MVSLSCLIPQPLLFHSDCQGQMYQVGYKINGTFLELYRSCYDKVNYITRYAEAYIYPSKNIINADRPKCTFTKDGIMSDRGHLIAADDFLTYDQKVATFKMVNVIPQFNSIQATGNWFKIEKFVRSLADQQNNLPRIYVQTGSYGVLTLSDTADRYLPS
ncbi:uncharacterized protein Dwil_GK27687 [Drosophila willistoni]|uniref:DNA/RNA non-specific endonuclease/pyrophosphatase/phosphodiesterase domain-containing protein n=1 Tax=Drosophila willistoni TaxID=7260 RepID=A0A0Q9WS74_DROWI|nr:uncharacterized protein Dwil_GK27687 [Drosophila willistoni]